VLQPDTALSGPGLPSNGIAHVLNLPAVKEGLAHDLMIRQLVHSHQPAGGEADGVYVSMYVYHASGCVYGAGAEAGEGQVSAGLPDVLLL